MPCLFPQQKLTKKQSKLNERNEPILQVIRYTYIGTGNKTKVQEPDHNCDSRIILCNIMRADSLVLHLVADDPSLIGTFSKRGKVRLILDIIY